MTIIVRDWRIAEAGNLAACFSYPPNFWDSNPFDAAFSQNCQNKLVAVQWGSENDLPGKMIEMYSYTSEGKRAAKRLRLCRGGKDIDLDLQYAYDEKGRLSTITYPKGGPCLKYVYDPEGRPIQMTSGLDTVVKDVKYDAIFRRLAAYKHLLPESGDYLEQKQIMDSKRQLSSIIANIENSQDPIVNLEYEYDSAHRLARTKDHVLNDISSYEYDESGRLEYVSNIGDDNWEVEYDYDGFGNRHKQNRKNGAAPTLVSAHDPKTNRVIGCDIVYDKNGNINKLFDMELSFDVDNRLVAIEKQSMGVEQYSYNPSNLRIWKKLVTGEDEIYFYGNGGRRLATYILSVDDQGAPHLALQDYDMYFAGKLIRSNSKPIVLDRLSNIYAWIDAQNNVQRTTYYPFGEERNTTKDNRQKFGTYVRDEFSGLDYAEQRYYSSALGRFITPDPYEGSVRLGRPDSWNRYAYVENDPINNMDPHGLYTITISIPNNYMAAAFTAAIGTALGALTGGIAVSIARFGAKQAMFIFIKTLGQRLVGSPLKAWIMGIAITYGCNFIAALLDPGAWFARKLDESDCIPNNGYYDKVINVF
jgi:RHS repeat-associated protein